MKSRIAFLRYLVAAALLLTGLDRLQAQGARTPPLQSPVVHPDRTVTFRLQAPGAKRVELSGQFQKENRAMEKERDDIWSVTVGPVEPNLYPYHFVVDGIPVSDPANPELFPNERFKASLVDIPGSGPASYAVREVPHGEVTHAFYRSKAFGTRSLLVYTPPGYRTDNDARYPVLYLVSGTTDTEETWFRAGRVNFILDNLIADRKATPMIVVMPYGNMMMGMPAPTSLQAAEMYRAFNDELVGSIIPHIERTYRVQTTREQRAIAGFSRGGGQSLFTAFSNPDKFAWVGSYAAYLTPEVCEKYFPQMLADPAATNQQFKLVWLGVGRSDFLYPQAKTFIDFLEARKLQHRSLITEGGHTWMNARHYLAETLQLYFR